MHHKILYTSSAIRDIKKLDTTTKKKLKRKIEDYSPKPLHYARKLVDSRLGTYRWRAGNHRIIFDIDKNNIVILRVGHRKEIYK